MELHPSPPAHVAPPPRPAGERGTVGPCAGVAAGQQGTATPAATGSPEVGRPAFGDARTGRRTPVRPGTTPVRPRTIRYDPGCARAHPRSRPVPLRASSCAPIDRPATHRDHPRRRSTRTRDRPDRLGPRLRLLVSRETDSSELCRIGCIASPSSSTMLRVSGSPDSRTARWEAGPMPPHREAAAVNTSRSVSEGQARTRAPTPSRHGRARPAPRPPVPGPRRRPDANRHDGAPPPAPSPQHPARP